MVFLWGRSLTSFILCAAFTLPIGSWRILKIDSLYRLKILAHKNITVVFELPPGSLENSSLFKGLSLNIYVEKMCKVFIKFMFKKCICGKNYR